VIYLMLYPGLGVYKGQFNWTEVGQFEEEVAKGNAQVAPLYARFASMGIQQLSKDPEAMQVGDRLFMNNCSQCHGTDAKGDGAHFPNLTTGFWNWGGTPDQIVETITQGRTGVMPPIAAAVGDAEAQRDVANYVLSLSGATHDAARAEKGKEKFMEVCAACHGPDGTGNQAMGSRNLTKPGWFLGPRNEAHVIEMMNNGTTGEMPTWESKFTAAQIKVLAAYVWGRGGGVEPAAEAPAAAAPEAPASAAQ
jgi:cytochrome c oxidase cbb3-type subunit 3